MKNFFKSILFLIILILSFFYYEEKIFKRFDAFVDYAYYRIPKDSVDLLFVGSSHSYCTFNPRLFDHFLKCNSLNLGTDSQSFKITYFSILEILKYQKPKVIIIEVYPIVNNETSIVALRPHLDTMKFYSINKLSLIKSSLPINEGANNYTNTIYYHSRWKEFNDLRKIKYKGYEGWKGRIKNKGFGGYVRTSMKNTLTYELYSNAFDSSFSITDEHLNLLENLFKICKEKDIKVILTSPPTIKDYANTLGVLHNPALKRLMKKYEIGSIDFNDGKKKYKKICFFDNYHLSLAGADEVSFEMAQFLKENYPILLNTENYKLYEKSDRSPEYYFYSENQQEDSNFKTFNLNLKLEEEVFINNLKVYKSFDDSFDLFLSLDEDKSSDKIYQVALNDKEVTIDLDKIQLNFFTVKDDIAEYPKYYIRKIKGKKYIYKKDIKIPKDSKYYF